MKICAWLGDVYLSSMMWLILQRVVWLVPNSTTVLYPCLMIGARQKSCMCIGYAMSLPRTQLPLS